MQSDVTKFFKGFHYAFEGIKSGFSERNMRVHVFVAGVVVSFGIALGISWVEWCLVISLIAAVISAELFNTAIEHICNILRDELHAPYDSTKLPRDVAAGAVLTIAIAAALIGCAIFVPKIFALLETLRY